jgi:hexosaminidase
VVDAPVVIVRAAEVWGVLHAFETLGQLCEFSTTTTTTNTNITDSDSDLMGQPSCAVMAAPVSVIDAPRFPWRGVLLDTANHWFPVEDLIRTIDTLAANKMNVFHWWASPW